MMYKLLYMKGLEEYTLILLDVNSPENNKEIFNTNVEKVAELMLEDYLKRFDVKLFKITQLYHTKYCEKFSIDPTEELWELFQRQVGIIK